MKNPYRSFHELCWRNKIIQRDALNWRLVQPMIFGEVAGLPESRGALMATNGIMAFILRADDSIYEGHVQHFLADSKLDQDELDELKAASSTHPRKRKRPEIPVEDYIKLLTGGSSTTGE